MPAAPLLADDPVADLQEKNGSEGLAIDSWTSCPDWYGQRMDLESVIQGLVAYRSLGQDRARTGTARADRASVD